MKEIKGDLWLVSMRTWPSWIVIPVNGSVRRDRRAVMGRGVAQQAARRLEWLPGQLGERILEHGNHVFMFPGPKLLTFPVKHLWPEKADLLLIEQSARELAAVINVENDQPVQVYLPRVGCGNGRLEWTLVKPVLEAILDDRFVVVEKYP